MIRVTDMTLCNLDVQNASEQSLAELYDLLLLTGISFIEIGIPALRRLGEHVDLGKTVLRIQDPTDIGRYPGFVRYVCRHSGFETPKTVISEIQINDIREIPMMNRYQAYENIRVVGLDDLFQHDYLAVFARLRKAASGVIEFCPQNRDFCASALAVEWLLDGGDRVAVSFLGEGGYAALEEVMMTLRIARRYKPNLDLSVLRRITALYEEISGKPVPPHKAVVGGRIFDVESGVHVDGIFKNASNYEPFPPETVGMERRIIIGKHSGKSTVIRKLEEYGIPLERGQAGRLLELVRTRSVALGRSITDEEFVALAGTLLAEGGTP